MQTEPEQNERAEETELCISCVAPNHPDANFCHKCGAPLSAYAATAPFERIFAEGFIYREACARPRKLIMVLGVWVIFGFPALLGYFLIFTGAAHSISTPIQPVPTVHATKAAGAAHSISMPIRLSGIFGLFFGPYIVWKTTRNYFKQVPRSAEE